VTKHSGLFGAFVSYEEKEVLLIHPKSLKIFSLISLLALYVEEENLKVFWPDFSTLS
jgi:hypothetical protein